MLSVDGRKEVPPAEPRFSAEFAIRGGDIDHAGEISLQVREALLQRGVPAEIVRRAVIACYEAELNVVMYARRGELRLALLDDRIKVEVEDSGPGILDIDLALREGFSTATSAYRELGFGAGMGLPNIRHIVDQFYLISEPGVGTALWFDIVIPESAGMSAAPTEETR